MPDDISQETTESLDKNLQDLEICKNLAKSIRNGYLHFKETGDDSFMHDAVAETQIAFNAKNKLAGQLLGADSPWYVVFMATCQTNEAAKKIAIKHMDNVLSYHDSEEREVCWPNLSDKYPVDFFEKVVAKEIQSIESHKDSQDIISNNKADISANIRNSLNIFREKNLGLEKEEEEPVVQPVTVMPSVNNKQGQNPYALTQGENMKIIMVSEPEKPEFTKDELVACVAATAVAALGVAYVGSKIFSRGEDSVMKGVKAVTRPSMLGLRGRNLGLRR